MKEKNLRKKNVATSRGITLIALVITIIVMLILVAVTISIAINGGLFNYAGKATGKTKDEINKEQELANGRIKVGGIWYDSIGDYLNNVASEIQDDPTEKGPWVDNGDGTFTNSKTKQKVEIADYVDYDCKVSSYEGTWRVLGVENGNLLLVSGINVEEKNLSGQDGYNNGVKYLNEICEKYAEGTIAKSGRSIKVEDINKITGYNPACPGIKNPTAEQIASGTPFGDGEIWEYGNKVTYKIDENGEITYDGTNGVKGTDDYYKEFTHVDGTRLVTNEEYNAEGNKEGIATEITVESNAYGYYPNTLTIESSGNEVGLSESSEAYKMLFENTGTVEGSIPNNSKGVTLLKYNNKGTIRQIAVLKTPLYWLASPFALAYEGNAFWGLCCVYDDGYGVGISYLWDSGYGEFSFTGGVRAVVTLSSDVTLTAVPEAEHQFTIDQQVKPK